MLVVVVAICLVAALIRAQPEPCTLPEQVDVIWMLDGSSSMANFPARFDKMRDFVLNYTLRLNSSNARVGFVEFAGPAFTQTEYRTIISHMQLTSDFSSFNASLREQIPLGGSTDVSGALDFVRTNLVDMTTASRSTVVLLLTDGNPTDYFGVDGGDGGSEMLKAETAARELRSLPNVRVAFLHLGGDELHEAFMQTSADLIYKAGFDNLMQLLEGGEFLCNAFHTFSPTTTATTANVAEAGAGKSEETGAADAGNGGMIAGGVFGALGALALLAAVFFVAGKQRRQNDGAAAHWEKSHDQNGVPFWINRRTGEFSNAMPLAEDATVLATTKKAGGDIAPAREPEMVSLNKRTGEFSYTTPPSLQTGFKEEAGALTPASPEEEERE